VQNLTAGFRQVALPFGERPGSPKPVKYINNIRAHINVMQTTGRSDCICRRARFLSVTQAGFSRGYHDAGRLSDYGDMASRQVSRLFAAQHAPPRWSTVRAS